MEDSPLFNAGKGAVFTNAGTNELDAAIMNGADLKAGAVAGGVICIDAKGNIAMPFNTKGMYRGYIKSDGKAVTLIYKKD
jgi:isoaspartyl peptidase/L-asparaginase-like protein (Ntn-hydrolase superfamily)